MKTLADQLMEIGKNLDNEFPVTAAKILEGADALANPHPLSDKVVKLEQSKKDWEDLCREILATVMLDGNKEWFSKLPPEWHELVVAWKNKMDVIVAEER